MLQRVTLIAVSATLIAFAALLLSLPTGDEPPARTTANDAGNSFVINNVRVFDGTDFRETARVTVEEGVVARIEDASDENTGDDAIDGSGMTLLPGLIDAHTHSYGSARRDALQFGVTAMLDMFTAPALLTGQKAARKGFDQTNEAALFSSGMLATVDGGHGTQFGIPMETISSPDQASEWVAARKQEGSDYIKLVYIPGSTRLPSLDYDSAKAIIDAAHAQDMLAMVHIDTLAAASEMLEAGVDGFVHVFADKSVSEAFITAALDAGVFMIPTLSIIAMVDGQAPGQALLDDADIAPFLTTSQRNNLPTDFGGKIPGYSLSIALDNVRRMHAAGIPILAGSDAPNPGTAHGATLHHELLLLTEAGLNNNEALTAGTALPAEIFSTEGRGTITVGDRADLLLVNGNPAEDIRATRGIETVFRNGYRVARGDDVKQPASERDLPELLGDFSNGLEPQNGLVWATTSDEMMGGKSGVTVSVTDDGTLSVDATVSAAFPYPWAGAYLGVLPEGSGANAAAYRNIEFDVRGTAAEYRLMIFVKDSFGTPPTVEFQVTEEWTQVTLPTAGFGELDWDRLSGLAIVTPMQAGDYDFEIDNVRMLP